MVMGVVTFPCSKGVGRVTGPHPEFQLETPSLLPHPYIPHIGSCYSIQERKVEYGVDSDHDGVDFVAMNLFWVY